MAFRKLLLPMRVTLDPWKPCRDMAELCCRKTGVKHIEYMNLLTKALDAQIFY
jgi:hypothetical protein